MRLTEEQKMAIIIAACKEFDTILENAIEDRDDLEFDFKGYDRNGEEVYSNHGRSPLYNDIIEELCYQEGLPGIPNNSDIDIWITYEGECEYEYHYEPQTYWDPGCDEMELLSAYAIAKDIGINITYFNQQTEEWEDMEVFEEDKKFILDAINEKLSA